MLKVTTLQYGIKELVELTLSLYGLFRLSKVSPPGFSFDCWLKIKLKTIQNERMIKNFNYDIRVVVLEYKFSWYFSSCFQRPIADFFFNLNAFGQFERTVCNLFWDNLLINYITFPLKKKSMHLFFALKW